MKRLRRFFSLPLLAKELTERSARWQTYGVRVAFALGLYGLVAFLLPPHFWNTDYAWSDWANLGTGDEIFDRLISVQSIGIALFLPALMCGSITREKERDSLGLLLLTDLGPWRILLEKYLGGLVLVLSFILLGAPLMAVAYSLGGVDEGKIVEQAVGMVLIVLQLGALTLFCSVWCRTTVGALLNSYFLGALMYFALAVVASIIRYSALTDRLGFFLTPPALLEDNSLKPFGDRVLEMLPSLLCIPIFLGLARYYFLRRAFLPASGFLRRTFLRLDAFMQRANRLTGHLVLVRKAGNLPADAPIFWRETRTRALGRPHYLVRLLLVAEVLTVLVSLLLSLEMDRGSSGLIAVLGGLATLVVAVQAANVIVSERVNQTLEVLLSTPIAAAQIVREKERALRRLLLVVAAPVLTVVALDYNLQFDSPLVWSPPPMHFYASLVLALGVYLPLVTWLAMLVGLRLRTRLQATVVTLVLLVAWCALPLIAADQFEARSAMALVRLLSPLGVFFREKIPEYNKTWLDDFPWGVTFANFAAYGLGAWALRALLLRRADRWLRLR